VTTKTFGYEAGNVQSETIATEEEFAARHVRITIRSGYDNFCAIYRASVDGSTNLFSSKVYLIKQRFPALPG
jgi:hypothetical protein